MRVLGLDPGLTRAGFGVVDWTRGRGVAVAYGVIRTAPGAVPERLRTLHARLSALIAEHRPEAVAVERVLFNANARTAMSVGQAAGVMLLAAASQVPEVAEYTPSEVKLAVAGYGAADKDQVTKMVARLLGLKKPPTPADAADALALALTHAHAHRMRTLERRTRARVP